MPFNYKIYYLLLLFITYHSIHAQVQIKGTVYDNSQRVPLEGVSVFGSKGNITSITDSNGHYSIILPTQDSIIYSYLGKPTKPIAVKDIAYPWDFNMSLRVITGLLPNVVVRPNNHTLDSIQNRADYSKVFNFHKPNPLKTINVTPMGVGMDPNEIINLFRFKRNRRLEAFQKRLIQQEQDKYIDQRFNKGIVKKLTGLQNTSLDSFMVRYRPDYYFAQSCNDLELYQYIWESGKQFKALQTINQN